MPRRLLALVLLILAPAALVAAPAVTAAETAPSKPRGAALVLLPAGFAPAGITDDGAVAGARDGRAVLWRSGVFADLPALGEVTSRVIAANGSTVIGTVGTRFVAWRSGVLDLLEAPPGYSIAALSAVNDRGEIAGTLTGGSTGGTGAIWAADGEVATIGRFLPYAINSRGATAGAADGCCLAIRRPDGDTTPLDTLGLTAAIITGIGPRAQVPGWAEGLDCCFPLPVMWRPDGSRLELPVPAAGFPAFARNPRGRATAINDRGIIAGDAGLAGPEGFPYGSPTVWKDARIAAVLTIPGAERFATVAGINDSGVVVGTIDVTPAAGEELPDTYDFRPFVWRSGVS